MAKFNNKDVIMLALKGDKGESGDIKGVVANVSDLPSGGDEKNYVVTSTGHWYYWRDNTWNDGGVYQATEIADNSIEPVKTKFMDININNIVDKTNPVEGKFVNYYDGLEYDNSDYVCTRFQFVPEEIRGKTINFYMPNNCHICFYDSTKTYIQPTWNVNDQSSVLVPENAYYMRFSIFKENYDNFWVSISNFFDTNHANYIVNENNLYKDDNCPYEQLIDHDKLLDGYYIYGANGSLQQNEFFTATAGYIKLRKGATKIYFKYASYHFAFYDSDFNFVHRNGDNVAVDVYECDIPTGAVYLRVSFNKNHSGKFGVSTYEGDWCENGARFIKGYKKNKIVIGNGTVWNNLATAFQYVFDYYSDSDIYITDGEYDFGSLQLWNYWGSGLPLGKGNRYHFSPNCKIKCYVPSSVSDSVIENFSVFITLVHYGSFMIDGLNCEGGNLRYLIHDERGSKRGEYDKIEQEQSYYKNCILIRKDDDSRSGLSNCLGCGQGSFSDMRIENCYMECIKTFGQFDDLYEFGVHGNFDNTATEGSNRVVITNSYFKHGLRLNTPTPEQNGNQAIIIGSYLGNKGIYKVGTEVGFGASTWNVKEWNNTWKDGEAYKAINE